VGKQATSKQQASNKATNNINPTTSIHHRSDRQAANDSTNQIVSQSNQPIHPSTTTLGFPET
jgi:hypothetical protein